MAKQDYGVGMFFFPKDELKRNQAKKIFEVITEKEGLEFLGWRNVPIRSEVLGKKALECMPCIEQAFIRRPSQIARGLDFESAIATVAPAVATVVCMIFTWIKYGKPDVSMSLNASLAGLVAITAPCDVTDCFGAIIRYSYIFSNCIF